MDKKDLKVIARLVHEYNIEKQKIKEEKELSKKLKLEHRQFEKRKANFYKELDSDPERFINFLSESYEFTDAYSLEPEEISETFYKFIEFRSEMRSLVQSNLKVFLKLNLD